MVPLLRREWLQQSLFWKSLQRMNLQMMTLVMNLRMRWAVCYTRSFIFFMTHRQQHVIILFCLRSRIKKNRQLLLKMVRLLPPLRKSKLNHLIVQIQMIPSQMWVWIVTISCWCFRFLILGSVFLCQVNLFEISPLFMCRNQLPQRKYLLLPLQRKRMTVIAPLIVNLKKVNLKGKRCVCHGPFWNNSCRIIFWYVWS